MFYIIISIIIILILVNFIQQEEKPIVNNLENDKIYDDIIKDLEDTNIIIKKDMNNILDDVIEKISKINKDTDLEKIQENFNNVNQERNYPEMDNEVNNIIETLDLSNDNKKIIKENVIKNKDLEIELQEMRNEVEKILLNLKELKNNKNFEIEKKILLEEIKNIKNKNNILSKELKNISQKFEDIIKFTKNNKKIVKDNEEKIIKREQDIYNKEIKIKSKLPNLEKDFYIKNISKEREKGADISIHNIIIDKKKLRMINKNLSGFNSYTMQNIYK